MPTKIIEYVLVPDSSSARRLRRLVATNSARLGMVVGTWAELVALAVQVYMVDTDGDDSWDDCLCAAVAALPTPFGAKRLEVAPHEVVRHIDKTHWALLREHAKMYIDDTTSTIGKQSFKCLVTEASFNNDDDCNAIPAHKIASAQIKTAPFNYNQQLTPDNISPSQLHRKSVSIPANLLLQQYGKPLSLAVDLSPGARGTLLHHCYEIAMTTEVNFTQASRLVEYPLNEEQWNTIRHNIDEFHHHLQETLSPIAITCELQILFINQHNSVVSGIIDLLVECENDFWIIDYKSDETANDATNFASYLSQLMCYADAVTNR